jgi:hypothetical protein
MRTSAIPTLIALCITAGSALAQEHGHRQPLPGHRPAGPVAPAPRPAPPGQWWDGSHGHGHYYPVTGWRVHAPPPRVPRVPWHGVRYGYFNGVWYAPYGASFVVVRPPVGVVVSTLPTYHTVVGVGGVSYLYANGVYYREASGGYEVVPSPIVGAPDASLPRTYVYPKLNQSAEKQASDEYECHRWAVNQTGFDPSAAATGQNSGPSPRADYVRAQTACLEGRGYTVR